jgi:hypothetical protein
MIRALYIKSITPNIAKVTVAACITIPGYWSSKNAENIAITTHSTTAYTGARYGAVSFLKIIMRENRKVQIIIGSRYGARILISTYIHVSTAESIVIPIRIMDLFIVPSIVIVFSPPKAGVKVSSFIAGLAIIVCLVKYLFFLKKFCSEKHLS